VCDKTLITVMAFESNWFSYTDSEAQLGETGFLNEIFGTKIKERDDILNVS